MLTEEQHAIVKMQSEGSGPYRHGMFASDAGCGKTHTITALVDTIDRIFNAGAESDVKAAVIVCAELGQATLTAGDSAMPWGRAPAETISYLIGQGGTAKVWKPLRRLARQAKLAIIKIIIDEWSMVVYKNFVDLCTTAYWTARGTPCKVSIAMFGDEKQLPAVGHSLLSTVNTLNLGTRHDFVNPEATAFAASNFTLAGFLASNPQAARLTQSMRFNDDDDDIHALAQAVKRRDARRAIDLMRCLELTGGYPRPPPTPGIANATYIMHENKEADKINTQACINLATAGKIMYFLWCPKQHKTTQILVQDAQVVGTTNVRTKPGDEPGKTFVIANGQRGVLQDIVGTPTTDCIEAADPEYRRFRRRCIVIDKHLEAAINLTTARTTVHLHAIPQKGLPVAIAAAATIHKMQGLTIHPPTRIVVDWANVTDLKLIYTAVTRGKSFAQYRFKNFEPEKIEAIMLQTADKDTAAFTSQFNALLLQQSPLGV
jgi:hypothetical protein